MLYLLYGQKKVDTRVKSISSSQVKYINKLFFCDIIMLMTFIQECRQSRGKKTVRSIEPIE